MKPDLYFPNEEVENQWNDFWTKFSKIEYLHSLWGKLEKNLWDLTDKELNILYNKVKNGKS